MSNGKKVIVIGAGASGLCAARHAISHGYDVTIFEQSADVGGTWVYTDSEYDRFGLPIHSSMYQRVRTNLPKERMGFPDFEYPNDTKSFVPYDVVHKFFLSYANHYHLQEKIKFEHYVLRLTPTGDDNRWEVIVRNLNGDTYETHRSDFVFVCNGHNSKPSIPDFPGKKQFKGKQLHSHSYSRPERFEGDELMTRLHGEDVLLIGAGPSGRDILYNVATKARKVVISTHRDLSRDALPSNAKVKPDVKEIRSDSVIFVDNTEETFTTILYCTGYRFSFPFLSVDSGVNLLGDYYLSPLYKHVLNINHPTMAFIGLQMSAYTTIIYDLQVRFSLSFWSQQKALPSRDEMLEDTRIEVRKQWDRGVKKRMVHFLDDANEDYCRQLAEVSGVEGLPEVYFKMYRDTHALRTAHPNSYRNYNYKILDDHTYERSECWA